MKAHTENGRKILNKVCTNCKHLMCKINDDLEEQVFICGKNQEDTQEFYTCDDFELEGDVE